jgi:D123
MLTRQKEVSDLVTCSYQNWYDDFRKNSIKSFVLPIPAEALKYFRDEFFILPKECAPVGTSSASFVGEETNFEDEDSEDTDVPEFPEFSKQISETLKKLGKNRESYIDYCFILTK